MRTLALALDVNLDRDQTTLTCAADQELESAFAKPSGKQETIQSTLKYEPVVLASVASADH